MFNQSVILSFPRSGRNLCQRWFTSYFGSSLKFVGDKNLQKRGSSFAQAFDSGYHIVFTHNHKNIRNSNAKTIILIRHPLYSIISWWEYWNFTKEYVPHKKREFFKFASKRFVYWEDFIRKSCLYFHDENVIFTKYQDLVYDSESAMSRLIRFTTSKDADEDLVKRIVQKHSKKADTIKGIKRVFKPRNLEDCPFYQKDNPLFRDLQKRADETFAKFGLDVEMV